MNPANFPNVGGAMNGGVKPHGQMQLPAKPENNQIILQQVAQALQAQGQYSGWRAEVPIRERALKVYQMITSLRLIQPRIDMQNAAHAALTFEQKAFKEAGQKADYERECNEKLLHIRDTRARQAAVMQGGMMPQGPAMGMPGVGQPPFNPQMNRPVQASPLPGQQQMSMGMGDLNQQAAMQHRQQAQQQHQNLLQQQRPQQKPANGAALSDDLNTLSASEYEQVCRIASQIISKTSPEDLEKIKMNLQNMTPEQRGYLQRKNMDPITYFFRSQALNQLKRYKKNRSDIRPPGAGVDPNGAMMGDPMMNTQRHMFQNMMNAQRNSFSVGGQQGLDPSSFIGNVENIQGQQADGLRSQEAGQLVVPASSSQMNQQPFTTPQNMFQVGQQLGQGAQGNMNGSGISPQFLAQQHVQNAQTMPQDRSQQASQFQAQPQAQSQSAQDQARVQAAAKVQFAMSQNQPGARMQHQMSQQSPAMPMLNRPMAPGQISPPQGTAQVRPPSRPQGMGQQPGNVQMNGQPSMQRPQIPPNLPPQVQEQLNALSNEQLSVFLMNHQRRALANNQALARANASQQSMPMQQNLSQSNQGQQMVNGQMINGQMQNGQNLRASLNLQQQLAGMGGAQAPNQMLPGQMSVQQRQQQQQQQRQQDLYKLQLLRAHSGGMEMSPEQVKEMDRLHFPPAILNNNPNISSAVPKNIKTWGQLKHLAATNPQLLGGADITKLLALQKLHLAQILAQSKENARNPEQGGQGPWMPTPFQGQPQPLMNPQLQAGQQQMPMNMPVMRPISAQDIQLARQRLGSQVQNLSDDQLRELLHRNRQKQIQVAQGRAAQALAAQQAQQQSLSAPQPPVTVPPSMPQAKSEPQPSQQTAQQSQQSSTTKAQAQPVPPGKNAKGPVAKQAQKRKLPHDESTEPQSTPSQKPAPPAPAQVGATPTQAQANMLLTREQLAAMTPQQRVQFEAQLRRQQLQSRGPVSRPTSDEQWNNMPEKLKQLYNEIARNTPPGEPAPITPEQKATMTQQLRDIVGYLSRMDTLIQFMAKVPGQEKNVHSLLSMRVYLMRQFKAGPDWTLNDQYTISPQYLSMYTSSIKKLFHTMLARLSQQMPGPRLSVSQGAPAQQASQPNMPALNASNLQQLQQQEEALQRARRASSQTVSGAAAIPQAPFGAPSPQGVPHAYGPGSIPPEQLKLPPPKKRKQSQTGATPVSVTPTSKAQAGKPADARANGAALGGAFKCSVPECQHHYQGFAAQNALDKHIAEAHQAEEPIENPLEFALESFRNCLVKDEDKSGVQDMKSIPLVNGKAAATSSPSKHEVKLEAATPVPASATPMGRATSQVGPKPSSPASNQQLTPRTSTTKTAVPSPLKPTAGKDGKKEPAKLAEPGPSVDAAPQDPWANSAISLDAIQDTFMEFADDGGLGFGAMDEFLNPEMFTNTQAKDTPDSVETGLVTQTPKDTELPKTDDLSGKNEGSEGSWLPADWVAFPGRLEDGIMMTDPWEEFDWDLVERKDGAINVDDSGIAICAI
ncbi:hypothetical protein BDQ94DRAFT_180036 [Aspergillus welwitschiae]|uniref:Mediator complex subunit 15 KIX domain-containing protein n=1 Tax=Aspergillus welwitschiae TaxID=1341132 RepID=A0A3F3PY68_9EURO|nr:hypothetical protein BDQ94DRAFT_180036 [Aspergillus welwitschiae]RDH31863.1 hypothetical protein BDQ94DRAFT_180036 [Aspergillus welwitschiae]